MRVRASSEMSLADRTFQDLTQYPIFPWIISDYTSDVLDLDDEMCYRDLTKPMGALNPDRLCRLKERFDEMADPKFIYGSHYSAPGLVLFYLVRKYPNLMLCLQNGRFDHPDRMFNKVSDVFNNCLNNMSDFKELIPEFYDTSAKGDFLLNNLKINFGARHDGEPVNHVQLPPWANGSPEFLVETFRTALESDYVSRNLNHWIDLIFGYKQRGEEAIKANNLFFHLCYEGSVDLDEVNDLRARHALEVQISEFGQVPKQLFNKPHVPKARSPLLSSQISEKAECCTPMIDQLVLSDQVQSHKNVVSCVIVDAGQIISTGKDGLLKCYDFKERRQTRSVFIGNLPLSCCVKIPDTNTVVLGSWDNTIMTYNLDFGRVSNVIPAHDDAVSTLIIVPQLGILISGSWDCSVKIWKGFNSSGCVSFRMCDAMVAYLSLEEKVSTIDASFTDENMLQVAVGTFSGEILLWKLRANKDTLEMETIDTTVMTKHLDEVTSVRFNQWQTKIASASLDGTFHVCDITTGMLVLCQQHSVPIICLDWKYSEELLVMGDENGNLILWNMMTGTEHIKLKAFSGLVSGLVTANREKKIVVAGIDGNEAVGDRNEFAIKVFDCV